MRDIELTSATDLAYASPAPGGLPVATAATDPSRTDANCYFKVSLGGEFGPARANLLSQPVDGGVANLAAAVTIIVTPPVAVQPAPTGAGGRAWNPTTVLNLYPWRKVPAQGMDFNNPT